MATTAGAGPPAARRSTTGSCAYRPRAAGADPRARGRPETPGTSRGRATRRVPSPDAAPRPARPPEPRSAAPGPRPDRRAYSRRLQTCANTAGTGRCRRDRTGSRHIVPSQHLLASSVALGEPTASRETALPALGPREVPGDGEGESRAAAGAGARWAVLVGPVEAL